MNTYLSSCCFRKANPKKVNNSFVCPRMIFVSLFLVIVHVQNVPVPILSAPITDLITWKGDKICKKIHKGIKLFFPELFHLESSFSLSIILVTRTISRWKVNSIHWYLCSGLVPKLFVNYDISSIIFILHHNFKAQLSFETDHDLLFTAN